MTQKRSPRSCTNKLRENQPHGKDGQKAATDAAAAEDKFWEELKDKGFHFGVRAGKGNPAASRWQRALKSVHGLKERYAAVGRDREAQAEFKAKWLEGKYEKHKESKVQRQTQMQEWVNKGAYITLGRMAWKGGGATRLRGTINIALDSITSRISFFETRRASR